MVCSCALGQVLVCSPRVRLLGTVALTCRRGSLLALEFLKKLNKFQSWERTWSGHTLMTRTPSHKDWSITAGDRAEKSRLGGRTTLRISGQARMRVGLAYAR